MNSQQINYEPLEAMSKAWSHTVKQTLKVPSWLVWMIVGGITVVSIYRLGDVGALPLIAYVLFMTARVAQYKNNVWHRFAAVNGLEITRAASIDKQLFLPPSLPDHAKVTIGDIVHINISGYPCDVFACTIQMARKKRGGLYYTVARVRLAKSFPHLILDSKRSLTPLVKKDDGSKIPVRLEGGFDQYFMLYHDKGEHIDALSIITPDVMHTLIESNQAQDIEIADKNLFFIINDDHRNPRALRALLNSVYLLAGEIAHKAKTINYRAQKQERGR